jgi:hypothetical protein
MHGVRLTNCKVQNWDGGLSLRCRLRNQVDSLAVVAWGYEALAGWVLIGSLMRDLVRRPREIRVCSVFFTSLVPLHAL